MSRLHTWLYALFLVLLSVSCGEKNRFMIDVKKEGIHVEIERFDRSLDSLRRSPNLTADVQKVRTRYGKDFFDNYSTRVVQIGTCDSVWFNDQLLALLNDSMYRTVYDEVQAIYVQDVIDTITMELETAWAYLHHYFPEKPLPRVYAHISGFNQSIVRTEDVISVSLDNYLGSDYAPYSQIAYNYQLNGMNPSNVSLDIVYGYIQSEFETGVMNNLLENIIERGKQMYLLKVLTGGEKTEAELMGYTAEQGEWCKRNESAMWQYLMDNRLLFNTSHLVISRFVNPAPWTTDFPRESPGQAVVWLGMRIVESYMNANKEVTLSELMQQHDAQKILSESNYKPDV